MATHKRVRQEGKRQAGEQRAMRNHAGVQMIDPTTPDERPDLTDDSQEDFDRRLAKMYPDVDWTEADKDFLRASGLI